MARFANRNRQIERLQASNLKSQKLQDAVDELRTERDNLARKANTAEKYKQKLQAGSDLQKENLGLRDELAELRQDYERARQARTQIAGLQQAVDEYKRVLPKIEQERHELQMMKKQLEFDNAALAQRCDKASGQYKRDQATIAGLNERLGDPSSTPNSPATRGDKGLDDELTERADSDERLRAKSVELKNENRTLQSAVGDSEAKIGMLEQMLDDVREHAEERDRKHLETYQENLILQSSLHALEKGQTLQEYEAPHTTSIACIDDLLSTEIFKKTQDRLAAEQTTRSLLEKQLKSSQDELRQSQNDRKHTHIPPLLDENANYRSVSLVDKNKLQALEEVKRQQSTELIIVQKENKALQLRTTDLETDRAGLQALLRDHIGKKPSGEATITNNDLKDLLEDLKAVLPDGSAKTSNEIVEKSVDAFGSKVREMNALISAREEVHRQSTKFSNPSSSTTTPSLSLGSTISPSPSNTPVQHPSPQQQQSPTPNTKRQSTAGRFSGLFTARKANSKPSPTANPEAEFRAPDPARLPATPPLPPPPTRAAYARKDWDTARRSGQ